MNAKEELLKLIEEEDKTIKCAKIEYGLPWLTDDGRTAILKVDYTKEDYEKFLNDLDFEYGKNFDEPDLDGIIWFIDNTWADREIYLRMHQWEIRILPEIPEELLS